ncbi:MAG: tetratricopeptide repeat protein [Deferribacteres bacterium]|nr:tetratricopeptide repeat protein [candidate division KSB1 bacterium]MCB9503105.1 tetratricopeptide repeat protein [Deferribacteres bacterium]
MSANQQLLQKAINLHEADRLREAFRAYRIALCEFRNGVDKQYEAYTLDQIGEVLQALGYYKRSLPFHRKAIKIAEMLDDLEIQASASANIGMAYYLRNQFYEAELWFKSSKSHYKNLRNPQQLAIQYNNMGLVYSAKNDFKQATAYFKKALRIFKKQDEPLEQAYTLQFLANTYRLAGYLEKGEILTKQSLKLQIKQNNPGGIAECYSLLGGISFLQDQHHLAEEQFLSALNAVKDLHAPLHKQHIFTNLANVYIALNRLDDASNLLDNALELSRFVNNQYEKAHVLDLYGLVMRELGDYYDAINSFEESLTIREEIGIPDDIELSLYNIATTYNRSDQLSLAEQYFLESIKICEKYGFENDHASSLTALGVVYDKMKNFDKSRDCHEKAIMFFTKTKDHEGLWAAYSNLGNLFELGLNDIPMASNYYQLSIENLMHVRNKMSIDFRVPYVKNKIDVFNQLIAIYVAKNEFTNAFKFLELSKSRAMTELMDEKQLPKKNRSNSVSSCISGDSISTIKRIYNTLVADVSF